MESSSKNKSFQPKMLSSGLVLLVILICTFVVGLLLSWDCEAADLNQCVPVDKVMQRKLS